MTSSSSTTEASVHSLPRRLLCGLCGPHARTNAPSLPSALSACMQARYSPIQFDYLSYSGMRWAELHRRKQHFVAQLDAAFPLA